MNVVVADCPECGKTTHHIHAMLFDNSGEVLRGYRVSCNGCELVWDFMLRF